MNAWPDGLPSLPSPTELTEAAKRRTAAIVTELESEGVTVTVRQDHPHAQSCRPRDALLRMLEIYGDLVESYLGTWPPGQEGG